MLTTRWDDGHRLVLISGAARTNRRRGYRGPPVRSRLPDVEEGARKVKGIDTAEVYGVEKDSEEYRRGKEHSNFARAWFEENAGDEEWPFVLVTEKDHGKYGRWPGRIVSKSTGRVYNEDILGEFPEVAS